MPNKHKKQKLINKLLISGKLDKKENVKKSREYLAKKIAIDQEGIDFDCDLDKNGEFEKLDPSEDKSDNKKAAEMPKKRKLPPSQTMQIQAPEKVNSTSQAQNMSVPKKSKNNKYFFLAHPEALGKKDTILNDQSKKKFVIDEEKIKLNKKKKKLPNKNAASANEEKASKGETKKIESANLWSIEECSESESDEATRNEKSITTKNYCINIDVDKSFKIKKMLKKLEDGSVVEEFVPEFVQEVSEEEDEETGEKMQENEENGDVENEDGKDDRIGENPLMDKLKSSRFRYLNEMLYSQPSQKSLEYFQK